MAETKSTGRCCRPSSPQISLPAPFVGKRAGLSPQPKLMNGSGREPYVGAQRSLGESRAGRAGRGLLGDFTPWQAIALFLLWAWGRGQGREEKARWSRSEGEDLADFSQHPPGHFSNHKPQSQATWLSWKQDGIEQMVSTSQIPIKQGRDGSERGRDVTGPEKALPSSPTCPRRSATGWTGSPWSLPADQGGVRREFWKEPLRTGGETCLEGVIPVSCTLTLSVPKCERLGEGLHWGGGHTFKPNRTLK